MTTVEAAAASRVRKTATIAAFAAILGLGLGGCETSSSLFGSASPDPAATSLAEQTPPAAREKGRVAIAPVIGAPDAIAKQMQASLGTALAKQSIAHTTSATDKVEYTLRGYVVSAREKNGTKISYIWDVTDPAGKRVNRITGEEMVAGQQARDPWASVTPQLVDTISTKTATSLATWLPTQSAAAPAVASNSAASAPPPSAVAAPVQTAAAPPPAATPAAQPAATTTGSIAKDGPVTAIVPSVTGAPGDGSVSLTSALQRELSRGGVALATKTTPQTYKVEGKVQVSAGKDGKQPIQIDWNVKDPAGKHLGTVSQKNDIPQGSLDGAWGKTADAAAAAAAQGILKLLNQGKATN